MTNYRVYNPVRRYGVTNMEYELRADKRASFMRAFLFILLGAALTMAMGALMTPRP